MSFPKRGEIYWVNLDPTVGTEINKKRPGLVVSNDIGNEISSRIIIAPITSNATKILPFEVGVEIKGKKVKVLLDQLRSIDKMRIENGIALLDDNTMSLVDEALKIALSLR